MGTRIAERSMEPNMLVFVVSLCVTVPEVLAIGKHDITVYPTRSCAVYTHHGSLCEDPQHNAGRLFRLSNMSG